MLTPKPSTSLLLPRIIILGFKALDFKRCEFHFLLQLLFLFVTVVDRLLNSAIYCNLCVFGKIGTSVSRQRYKEKAGPWNVHMGPRWDTHIQHTHTHIHIAHIRAHWQRRKSTTNKQTPLGCKIE